MKITKIVSEFLDSNVFVVEKDNHCIIVDCGANLDKVKQVVGTNVVDGILLTHGHFDHSVYCNEYANFFDTKVYANEKVKATLLDSEANYSEGKLIIDDFSKFVFIKEDCRLKIGDFEVECISAEGHSPCCECYKIDNNLFAGDVLFENGIGRTDLIGSNKQDMIKTISKLDEISYEKVFSGHGGDSDKNMQQKSLAVYKRFLAR